ncbi:MAG TPA: PQQ-dependent dehydrogenase, methanol/ethanol family [Steroidobacteraceae bacterium]|jgi:alcohol dehydrogenase (cytochrome c)/quinohemoprotein ethanol dehydrogenase|nr:PQQ-dependent dehydrogenase, methanol/ethanol family [Steroidobacteraceae bacterium]
MTVRSKRLGTAFRASLAVSLLGALLQCAAALAAGPAAVDATRLGKAASEPGQWLTVGRTTDEQRFSPLKQINTDNVKQLSLAWYVDFDSNRGQEATPLAIDGVLYFSTAWSKVKAVDARTGKLLWAYDPKVPGEFAGRGCCDLVNRGVAAWKGRIYVSTYDGRLVALDATTGAEVWTTLTIDHDKPLTSTGAPRIANGKVIIGSAGSEFGVRGYVSAYDAQTGKQLWRFYTVPGNPAAGPEPAYLQSAASTWNGDFWKWGGGGTVWDGIVYDSRLNLLFIGTGNGSPWNRQYRGSGGGDNLYIASIIAVNPDTGQYVWHYQETPGDEWDYDATSPLMLADLKIDGRSRRVLMQASKNGMYYVLDAKNGKVIRAKNFVPTSWTSGIDPVTGKPRMTQSDRYDLTRKIAIVQPGGQGAHAWHPFSYDPQTGLAYFSVIETSGLMKAADTFNGKPMSSITGLATGLPPSTYDEQHSTAPRSATSQLIAWDPVKEREVWRTPPHGTIGDGTLSTAGGLVFQGTNKGQFIAYRADNGQPLWTFEAQTGVVAAASAFEVDGQEYIAVEAGYGLVPFGMSNQSRLLVFKLNGGASLPPAPPPPPPRVLNPPPSTASKEVIAAGQQAFADHCAVCHETAYANRGAFPDLRYSPAIDTADVMRTIVLDGAMQSGGMASFKGKVSPAELEAIRAYLIERANQAKAAVAAGSTRP